MSSPLDTLRHGLDTSLADRATGLVGIALILGIAWLASYDRRRIRWRLVGAGLALQTVFGLLVLKSTPGRWFFESVGGVVNGLLGFTLQKMALIQLPRIAHTLAALRNWTLDVTAAQTRANTLAALPRLVPLMAAATAATAPAA